MISNIEISEAIAISKILKKSKALATTRVVKDIIDHINKEDSLALKMTDNDSNIIGIWCSKDFEEHVSLSFFYMDVSVRRKPEVIVFFKHCYELVNNEKPLVIFTKDTTGFDKYVVKIGKDLYQFVGLR